MLSAGNQSRRSPLISRPEHNLARNLLDWVAGCAMVYFALFGVGELCLLDWKTGALLLLLSLLSAAFVYRGLSQVPRDAADKSAPFLAKASEAN